MINQFIQTFGAMPEHYFSAPGRTELGGNHTDHQRGRVLAAAVSLEARAVVRRTPSPVIRIQSEGYPLCVVALDSLEVRETEHGTTAALVRGVAARMLQLGCPAVGFDAYVTSDVLPGSGLSSSAAFEVLIATIFNALSGSSLTPAQLAAVGQYAENVYFGKPCGLMDQMASAVGGLISIDFGPDSPNVCSVDFDFSTCGHALCIIDTGAGHENLTPHYAAIPAEMRHVAAQFQKPVLSQVLETAFYQRLPQLRAACGDRAVLRAIHFFEENARVVRQVEALQQGDFPAFLSLVNESGRSSWMHLQNVIVDELRQEMGVALALCQRLLRGQGAFRVHGGGFAGTVQAFVPQTMLEDFRQGIEAVLGPNACHVLTIRTTGATESNLEELS